MAAILTRGANLPPAVVEEMFNGVKGHSALARLSDQRPIAFNGTREFVFTLDKEADLVAENGPKSNGGGDAQPVTIIPVKFEYGMRVSDEFMIGSEEYRLDVLRTFAEASGKVFARGLDIAAFHGVNPRTGQPSTITQVANMNFDTVVTQTVTYDATQPDNNLEAAVALIQGSNGDVTGIAMAPTFSAAMAQLKVNGVPQFPEFRFGANPENLYGKRTDVNSTVAVGAVDEAIVGDFARAFRWGYAKDIALEVIEYGNPDNDAQLGDLKGHNQVYLRCEAYIGWGILAPSSFARITD